MEIIAEPLWYDRGLECIPNLGGRGCRIDLRDANVGLDLAYEPPPILVRVNLRITVSLASSFDCTAILQWSGEPLITVCERSLSETTLLIRVNSSEVRSQSCGTYSLSIDAEIVISSLYRASTPFELIYIYIYICLGKPDSPWRSGL